MKRSELKERICNYMFDPWGARDEDEALEHISLQEAKNWLVDIRRDQTSIELEEDERIPDDLTPTLFRNIWNEICDERKAARKAEEDDDDEEDTRVKKTVVEFRMLIPETDEEVTLTVPESMPAGDVAAMLAPFMTKALIGNVITRLED